MGGLASADRRSRAVQLFAVFGQIVNVNHGIGEDVRVRVVHVHTDQRGLTRQNWTKFSTLHSRLNLSEGKSGSTLKEENPNGLRTIS